MSSRSEKALPLLAAFAVGIVAGFGMRSHEIDGVPALCGGLMVFGIIAAWFSAMQRNAFMGMVGSRVMEFAIKTGFYADVVGYFMHCVYGGVGLAIVAFAGFWLPDAGHFIAVWFGLVSGVFVFTAALMVRNEILMTRIVRRFIEE